MNGKILGEGITMTIGDKGWRKTTVTIPLNDL
jgi:hypothetical protein